jgi:hypothetical protein
MPPQSDHKQKSVLAFGFTYVLSATSACAAEGMCVLEWRMVARLFVQAREWRVSRVSRIIIAAVTFPLDMIKTRLQAQGEAGACLN